MTGRIGIDFGTSSTVVAHWDAATDRSVVVELPTLGLHREHSDGVTSVVPSLIHFGNGTRPLIGRPVVQRNLVHNDATFRWMKPTLVEQLIDVPRLVGTNRSVATRQAASSFLIGVIESVAALGYSLGETCLTVPVHAFEDYQEWLSQTAVKAGVGTPMLIDEASAAAIGYRTGLEPGDRYLVFDFGGGTLDIAVVEALEPQLGSPVRAKVLGKGGTSLGGRDIDRWLSERTLGDARIDPSGPVAKRILNELLISSEAAKERLSSHPTARVEAIDPNTGRVYSSSITRSDLEDVFDARRMFDRIEETLRVALNQARDHNVTDSDLKWVLMVGGSSLIPAVRKHIARRFGADRVKLNEPLAAVAHGAATLASGAVVENRIYHEYALKFLRDGQTHYRTIIPAGTAYPQQTIARLTATSIAMGQTTFHIDIYENDVSRITPGKTELSFGPDGRASIRNLDLESTAGRPVNTTPITATPSAATGESCIELTFDIDAHRRLLLTAVDPRQRRNNTLLNKAPVIRLR